MINKCINNNEIYKCLSLYYCLSWGFQCYQLAHRTYCICPPCKYFRGSKGWHGCHCTPSIIKCLKSEYGKLPYSDRYWGNRSGARGHRVGMSCLCIILFEGWNQKGRARSLIKLSYYSFYLRRISLEPARALYWPWKYPYTFLLVFPYYIEHMDISPVILVFVIQWGVLPEYNTCSDFYCLELAEGHSGHWTSRREGRFFNTLGTDIWSYSGLWRCRQQWTFPDCDLLEEYSNKLTTTDIGCCAQFWSEFYS